MKYTSVATIKPIAIDMSWKFKGLRLYHKSQCTHNLFRGVAF